MGLDHEVMSLDSTPLGVAVTSCHRNQVKDGPAFIFRWRSFDEFDAICLMAGPNLGIALRNMIPIFDRSESGNSPLRNISAEPLRDTKSFGNGVYP